MSEPPQPNVPHALRRSQILVATAALVLVASVALAFRSCGENGGAFGGTRLTLGAMAIDLRPQASRLVLSVPGKSARIPLVLRLRDGNMVVPLRMGSPQRGGEGGRVIVPVLLSQDQTSRARLVIEASADPRVLRTELHIDDAALVARGATLTVEAPVETRSVFVSGIGELADTGEGAGALMTLGEDPLVLGVASVGGITTTLLPEPGAHVGAPKIVRVAAAPAKDGKSSLLFAMGEKALPLFGALWGARGEKTEKVRGVVGGSAPGTRLYGLDEGGKTRLRAIVSPDGRFEVDVPADVNRWYAAVDETRVSAPMFFAPGAGWDLKLDVSAGGELTVRVRDADGDAPLVARVAVRGLEGTLDPNFGPDYRASGAGPLVDVRSGEVVTPLPSGRYRVSATRGIEWSIDAQDVTVTPGGHAAITLKPRHVVDTPEEIGCDLHVHARPSFDSPVLPEDRVLSLVSAGVDFAVPSEHNVVGDYAPAIALLDLARQFSSVPGVEVTTYTPRFGHFGVFPLEADAGVPPYRRTNAAALFAAVKRDPKRLLQVNHPRLPKDIGYFEVSGFDPKEPRTLSKVRTDFDLLEVYSGFDVHVPERVEAVLADYYALLRAGRTIVATGSSDAHRIQYNWAGYPRTMVRIGKHELPLDPTRVIDNLRRGRATVTSGPLIDLSVRAGENGEPVSPGGTISRRGSDGLADVVVRAAPWLDVSELTLVADGVVVERRAIDRRPSIVGPELGTLEEARGRAVRYRGSLPIPKAARWIMVIARGERKTDDVLPFMPIVPLAFTNPVWLRD